MYHVQDADGTDSLLRAQDVDVLKALFGGVYGGDEPTTSFCNSTVNTVSKKLLLLEEYDGWVTM